MKKCILLNMILLICLSCNSKKEDKTQRESKADSVLTQQQDSLQSAQGKEVDKDLEEQQTYELNEELAYQLAQIPLACIQKEYPNKLDHVISSALDVVEPQELHPAFYGCFDWHSSVHGHWMLIRLLKMFPDMKEADKIKKLLLENLSQAHIAKEVAYFNSSANKSSERTYGWAWLLKLSAEIHTWDDPIAKTLEHNLKPLRLLMAQHFEGFLPKLNHPIRVGEHQNTAFALVFLYDYAQTYEDKDLLNLVEFWSKSFYLHDKNCPVSYEPSGFDFLSPCLEEVDIMSRVLRKSEFLDWLKTFMPALLKTDFKLKAAKVSDREDGKLVHQDGLNYSRAWVLYRMANNYKELKHLKKVADNHFNQSFKNLNEKDSYMGSHWLGSFALYALDQKDNHQ